MFCNNIVFVYVSILFPWLVIFCELQRWLEEEGACDFLWDSSMAKKKSTCDFFVGFSHGQSWRVLVIFHELW